MGRNTDNLPSGNFALSARVIRSAADLGAVARAQRLRLELKQADLAGLGNTGNRFIVDLERGKPTLQLQMAMDLLDLLGLELVVQPKSAGTP